MSRVSLFSRSYDDRGIGYRVKTREVCSVLRRVIGDRTAGPLFQRPGSLAVRRRWQTAGLSKLIRAVEQAIAAAEQQAHRPLARTEIARLQRQVWRDAGALRTDQVRQSFIAVAQSCGLDGATCPKSWRHTFATLLQEANVDPLIRQLTMAHAPTFGPESALGMTAMYTHTRWSTQQREIARALRLWPASLLLAQQWAKGDTGC
ncbi:site-specific integrase [Lacipirellula limnantheis]|uniref:hypothetical protein n=1 Tax=Lacipirellula limnantheis TaxID=2528024 RepID=UPI0011A4DF00|nr:hypothetical protein [Lacipirellula limnantheis]